MKNVFQKGMDWVSDYKYHEDINWRPDHIRNTTLSKLQVIDAFDNGDVTYSDLYIVFVVHVMTFANRYQITQYTKWWKIHNKEIPLNPADDEEGFKGRIEALVKNSFLRRFKFKNSEGVERDYFYVTPHGYNFIRRKLYFNESYDEYLGAAPVQEVLKYLANNEILIEILKNITVENGYHMESKPLYQSHTQFFDKATHSNYTTYGFLNIRLKEHKLKVLIEPYRPTFDTGKYAVGQMEALEKQRFEFLERYIKALNIKNGGEGSLKIVFVAESLDAAKQLAKKLHRYESYFTKDMMITVDKIIGKHGLEKTFLKLYEKEGGSTGIGVTSLEIK